MRYRRLGYQYVLMTGSPLRQLGYVAHDQALGLAQLRWRPPADVYETPEAVVITVELPGVDENEIDLLLFEDAVVVEGQRRLARPEGQAAYQTAEIRQGRFRLDVPLRAPVDTERVDARYERGLLTVTLPKSIRPL